MPIYETADDVLAARPPVPVTLYRDWWTKAGYGDGIVTARGNNALVTCEEYLGTFSWGAVLQALNDSSHQTRLPTHSVAYLRKLATERPKSVTLKYLKGPKEQ